jgi:hypothetical protein
MLTTGLVKKKLPETLMPNTPVQDLPLDRLIHPHVVIHRLGIRLLVAQSRLLLNRAFFARAMKENPDDPSRAKHGASFVALYESTQEIVMLVKQLVIYHPSLIARWWVIISVELSAKVGAYAYAGGSSGSTRFRLPSACE